MPEYEIDYEVGDGWHAWTDPVTGERIVEHDVYGELEEMPEKDNSQKSPPEGSVEV